MKTNLIFRSIVFFYLIAVTQSRCRAQSYSVIHDFNGSDGANSTTGLTLSSNTLYGTTSSRGLYNGGTIFRINIDGTCFTNLFNFQNSYGTNSTGSTPYANLTVLSNIIYGTTIGGGIAGNGVVFAMQTDGSGFTTLHEFTADVNGTNYDGAGPYCNLLLVSNRLYGTTDWDGPLSAGTVFAVNTDGTGFTNLHSFTNEQGNPLGGLVASGNVLYGTTCGTGTTNGDGSPNFGSVFAMNMDGSGFTNLHIFISSDGRAPQSGLLLAGDTLYGTTFGGGPNDTGSMFSLKTDGTAFTNLHFFGPVNSNSDGLWPYDTPILHGNTLFATASSGGNLGWGTLFLVNTDGTGFRVYHSFDDNLDDGEPNGGLVLAGDTMYGVGQYGGPYLQSYGFVFGLSFAPQLTMTSAGTNLVVSWPTNSNSFSYDHFALESSPAIGSNAVWTTNASSQPAISNGNYVVTNSVASSQMFYRLRGN